jgi:hypothetical protein
MKLFFGSIEDNVGLLNVHWVSVPLFTSEPLLYQTYFFFAKFIDSIILYNLFLAVIFILNLIFIFRFFKLFNFSNLQVTISTLIVSLSPYFSYNFRSHLALINFWIVAYFLTILFSCLPEENKKSYITFLKGGLVLAVTFLISNYLGLFLLIITILYFLIQISYSVIFKTYPILTLFKNYSVLFISFSLVFGIFSLNYFNSLNSNINDNSNTIKLFDRGIENFFIFSSRPWYYILPSTDNPLFGSISNQVINFLQNEWGNFLTQNYFKSEHSSSFLGILNIVLGITGIYFVSKSYQKKELIVKYKKEISIFILFILLVIISMPPYFTISNTKIYMPSYLLYSVLPMFRVIARLGIFTLLFWMVFVNYGYGFLIQKLKLGNKKLSLYILLSFILTISLLEFYIPFKLTDVSKSPQIYSDLRIISDKADRFVVYPESKSTQAYFWKLEHQRYIVNFTNEHIIDGQIITNNTFTENIPSCNGIEILKKHNIKYLVVFKNEVEKKEKLEFLNRNLKLIKSYNQIDTPEFSEFIFFRIVYSGDTFSNQANLYEIIINESRCIE